MYFVELQKYKLPAAHYHYFSQKNILIKLDRTLDPARDTAI